MTIPGAAHHLELRWEEPGNAAMWRRIAGFAQVVVMDRRGCGLSDRSVPIPSIEDQVADVVAVMDAAGVSSAIVSGHLDGGWLAMLCAVRYPERVAALVLESTTPRLLQAEDYAFGISSVAWSDLAAAIEDASVEDLVALLAPSRVGDARFTTWFGRYWRSGAGPGGIRALMEVAAEVDLRSLLPRSSNRRWCCTVRAISSSTSPAPGTSRITFPTLNSSCWPAPTIRRTLVRRMGGSMRSSGS